MSLFRLSLASIFTRKVWFIVLLLVSLFPWFAEQLTPGSYNPTLVQPSRIQAAWSLAWIGCLIWGLYEAANLGHHLVTSRSGEFFRSMGFSKLSLFFQIFLACSCFTIPLALIAFLISAFGNAPTAPHEQAFWLTINFQELSMMLLVVLQLTFLAVGLGSRLGATVGLLAPLVIAFVGLNLLPLLSESQMNSDNPLLSTVLLVLPHYHFADLVSMMIFKTGALPQLAWSYACAYLAAYGLSLTGFSFLMFRTHR